MINELIITKNARKGAFCTHKPNSVGTNPDDHIPRMGVTTHLLRLSSAGYVLKVSVHSRRKHGLARR
jgi:hypothetical protein